MRVPIYYDDRFRGEIDFHLLVEVVFVFTFVE